MGTDEPDTDETDERAPGEDRSPDASGPGDPDRSGEDRRPGTYDNGGREAEAVPGPTQGAGGQQVGNPQPQRRYGSRTPGPTGRPPDVHPPEGAATGQSGGPGTGEARPGDRPAGGTTGEQERERPVEGGRDVGPQGSVASSSEGPRSEDATPRRSRPLGEPSGADADAASHNEDEETQENEETAAVPKYGGRRDPNWDRTRSVSAERERRRREYERQFDRQWDRQREFQVDKSGDRYRRR